MRRVVNLVSGRISVIVLVACAALMSSAPASAQSDIVLEADSVSARAGRWVVKSDRSAAGGKKIHNANSGAAKRVTAVARPKDYFELTFSATRGVPYRLWLHGKAERNRWDNDSVFVQFSNSVNPSGRSTYRIGTTSATEVNLEACKGCGLRGWKWQDNGWGRGKLGPVIYFDKSGTQKMRVQSREDGLSIDRILLSPAKYLRAAPPELNAGRNEQDDKDGDEDKNGGEDKNDGEEKNDRDDDDGEDDDDDAAPASSRGQLKVLDWNIHHGVGTDGDYDIARIAGWIAKTGANVVSLNEVEKYTGWGNEDQPARFASLLKSRTGKTWYYNFAQRDGNTNGQGNLILSTFPFESSGDYELSYSRSVARVAIIVNGIRVNVFSTHLDAESSGRRSTQMRELTSWADNYPEQRILVGDFNAWPGASETSIMKSNHNDAWAQARNLNIDVAYSGNASGNTRNSRIDYIWHSKNASKLKLKQVRVFDVRDSRGVMPSDHRPLMATYEVR